MLRDIALAHAATDLVARDLQRVLGDGWSCRLDDNWVLTLTDGARSEASLLDREVEDEAWYVDDLWPESQQRAALAADVTEAVAGEAIEILRSLGTPPLTCAAHGVELGACEGVW